MTVMYTDKVATASFGCFLKLLFWWKGSVYKLIWRGLAVYLVIYFVLSLCYRFAMSPEQQRVFENAVRYCRNYQDQINLTFVLGFYVSVVFTRWKDQYNHVPWPDTVAMMTTAYLNAPGLILPNEEKILLDIKTPYNKYPIPMIWATSVLNRARKENLIKNDVAVAQINEYINDFRINLGRLFLMDSVSIPIVYTQVVTLCTYIYFIFALMSQQFIEPRDADTSSTYVDLYVPIGSILQFLFYMGWLKVAEVIINPFGDDDDDFDINAYIDRNWQFSYLLVDDMHVNHPELVKDQYWDTEEFDLPYQDDKRSSALPVVSTHSIRHINVTSTSERRSRVMSFFIDKERLKLKKSRDKSSIGGMAPKYKTNAVHRHHTPFDNRFEDKKLTEGELAHNERPGRVAKLSITVNSWYRRLLLRLKRALVRRFIAIMEKNVENSNVSPGKVTKETEQPRRNDTYDTDRPRRGADG